MKFNRFANEIKFDIFATVSTEELCSKIAPVCREWRQFTYSSILWTDITLEGKTQTNLQMMLILNRCMRVEKLTINNTDDFSWLSKLQVHKSLRYLRVFDSKLNNEAVTKLLTIFPYVQVFNDSFNVFENVVIGDKIIRWQYLTAIRSLSDIENGDQFLDLVATGCPNLTYFAAFGCLNVNDKSFVNFVKQHGSHLTVFDIGPLDNLSTDAFKVLDKCHQLKYLYLSNPKNFSNLDLFNVLSLRNIKNVITFGSEKLFADGFSDLFSESSFSNIEVLNMECCVNVNYNDLNVLIKSLGPNIRMLSVSPTDYLTLQDCEKMAQMYNFRLRLFRRKKFLLIIND